MPHTGTECPVSYYSSMIDPEHKLAIDSRKSPVHQSSPLVQSSDCDTMSSSVSTSAAPSTEVIQVPM